MHLIRTRVNLRKQIAFLYFLPFAQMNLFNWPSMRLFTTTVLKASTDPRPSSRIGRSRTSAVATATGMVICAPPRPPLPPPPFCLASALVWPQPPNTNAKHAHITAETPVCGVKVLTSVLSGQDPGNLKSYQTSTFQQLPVSGGGRTARNVPIRRLTAPAILFDVKSEVSTLDFVNNC